MRYTHKQTITIASHNMYGLNSTMLQITEELEHQINIFPEDWAAGHKKPLRHDYRIIKRGAGMTKGQDKPWDAPGGKLESGETPIQAAVRELKEETGLTVDPAAVIGECYVPEGKVAVFVWHVDAELSARPLDGISQVQWLLRSELEGKACFRLSRAHTEAANKNLLTKKPKSGDVVKYGPNMTVTIA
jgi:8-oxo-dGTP diphosphatase